MHTFRSVLRAAIGKHVVIGFGRFAGLEETILEVHDDYITVIDKNSTFYIRIESLSFLDFGWDSEKT